LSAETCRDLGPDCDFEACEETKEEVLKTAVNHARAMHGLQDISEIDRVRLRKLSGMRFVSPRKGITHVEEACTDFCLP
jgi:predicted small metal-binding protein